MHGAVDGFLMTVLFSVVRHVSTDNSQSATIWSITNLAVGLGQLTGLPIAGKIYSNLFCAQLIHKIFRKLSMFRVKITKINTRIADRIGTSIYLKLNSLRKRRVSGVGLQ